MKLLRYILLFFLISFLFPQGAYAHAVLEKAVPTQDSQLQSAPNEIVLQFNERLEDELYYIKVFDSSGEEVGKSKTKLSHDQKQLMQTLPELTDGRYTVSYSLLSADGHPIKGSYIFSVGKVSGEKINISQGEQDSPWIFAVRIFYYITLLLVTGWIFWGTAGDGRRWAFYLQIAFFLANIGMGIITAGYLDQWNFNAFISLITGTTVGITWGISMILSVLGFGLLSRNAWLDRGWALLLLAVKSMNGHAVAFEPPLLTVTIDFIHLLAAAIWSGGLLYLLIYWKKKRNLLVTFSKTALVCLLMLIVTGVASTLIYLPDIRYLLFTQWGIYLLVKIILVLFVIAVAGCIRFFMKKNHNGNIKKLLKVDFALMLSILCIVGIFTQLSPLPENKPLLWKEKQDSMEFTTTISPKVPGTNQFMVVANTHEEGLKIKRIELILHYKDNAEVAPIRVPLEEYEEPDRAHFMIDGQYLPFSGNWTAEVRILDSEDNEKVYQKDFIVY